VAIPPKITRFGDLDACNKLLGAAKQQMALTVAQAEFQKHNTHTTVKRPYVGAEIKCVKNFEESIITIDAEKKRGGVLVEEWQECYCFPHFSMGIIKKVTPETLTDVQMRTMRFSYDIDICTKRRYVEKKDIYSAGWERYYVGQYVLVSIGAALDTPPFDDFDPDRSCLMQQPRFETLIVSPIHVFGGMKKWPVTGSRVTPV
jgi:hypothetical protein